MEQEMPAEAAPEAPPPSQPVAEEQQPAAELAAEAPTEPAPEPAAPTEPAPTEPAAEEPPAPAPELTEEQKAAVAAFAEIDADGDGELTADEIYQALAKNDATVSLERIHEIMERADKDHNGTISQQEYLDAVAEDILPPSWLGTWLGKLAKGVAAAFAGPEPVPVPTVSIDAPQGALGLVFERDSAVVCRIKDESPLLGRVELGWTLASINSNGSVLDTTTLDGAAVTNLLFARAEVERKLQFQKTEIKVSAPVAPPQGQVVAVQPTVGQVVAVQPEWQPPPFVRTPEAAQIVAWQHPEAAALEALRSFFTKLASLDGDAATITKAEFASCCANPEVGPQISNQDAVFDCLDVDGSGEISLDELLYAVAGRYMADTGPGTKEPAEAWRQAITGLSEALAELEAQGRPMDAKAFRKAQKSTQDLGEGDSSGVTCGKYCLAFVCPCSIICSGRGAAVGTSKKKKLIGMTAVMDYVIACKNAPAHYHWTVQNYHYETTYSTDENGNTTTSETRVDGWFARTGGALVSTDATPPFRPNTTKSSVALKSFVDAAPDENFQQEYEGQKQMFYQSNRTDTHQEHREWFTLSPMKPAVHVAWVAQEDPWYATVAGRNCAALTCCTAVAWLKAINGYMGKQKVTFKKTFSGFSAPQRTPKNLRDIAYGR